MDVVGTGWKCFVWSDLVSSVKKSHIWPLPTLHLCRYFLIILAKFGNLWTLLATFDDYFLPSLIISDHYKAFPTTFNHIQPFRVIFSYFWPFWPPVTCSNHFWWPFLTTTDYFCHYKAFPATKHPAISCQIFSHFRPPVTPSSHV